MSRKREFFLDGENPYSNSSLLLDRSVTRKNESCFSQVSLTCDGLAVLRRKAVCIMDYRQRIAGKWLCGEDINLRKGESTCFVHRLHSKRICKEII